jgi:hypothetical protein
MTPIFTHDWTNFFIAASGAAAALAGLVIVAMSVNIKQILAYSHLPSRAAAAIATLILILVSCMAGLVPQTMAALGLELLLFGIGGWILQSWSTRKSLLASAEYQHRWQESIFEIVTGQIQILPFFVAGILLMMHNSRGLYWMAGGVVAIFIFSVFNAWVLLVEILR